MKRRYVALLRGISNVSMQSFRERIEALGYGDVDSFGMSGNLVFTTRPSDTGALERRIEAQLRTPTVVRTRAELARAVAQDPFGSSTLFLKRAPTAHRRRAFLQLDFESDRLLLQGRTLFFVYPVRLRGQKTPFDLERALGVQGTARSSRIVARLLERMSEPAH